MKKNIEIVIIKKNNYHNNYFKNENYKDFYKEFKYSNSKIIIYDIKFIYNILIILILKYKILIILIIFLCIITHSLHNLH